MRKDPTRSSASRRPDVESGRLNLRSPLARALIGKDVGDSVEVNTPGGGKNYEILKIEFV